MRPKDVLAYMEGASGPRIVRGLRGAGTGWWYRDDGLVLDHFPIPWWRPLDPPVRSKGSMSKAVRDARGCRPSRPSCTGDRTFCPTCYEGVKDALRELLQDGRINRREYDETGYAAYVALLAWKRRYRGIRG